MPVLEAEIVSVAELDAVSEGDELFEAASDCEIDAELDTVGVSDCV